MAFLVVFACAAAASFALKPVIKRVPAVWYLAALALVGLYVAGTQGVLPAPAKAAVFFLVQKGTLATALFAVVMFIGAFPTDARARRWLAPIRAELSIVACILICGHVAAYVASFLPRLVGGLSSGFVVAGLVAGLAVALLGALLGVTSVAAVKERMAKRTWKRVQRLAYVFFGLAYVHVLAMLLPSALAGGASAQQSVAAYTVVFGAYAVARIARALRDRRA